MTAEPDDQQQEIERLRARVAQLEAELVEQAARMNAIVAESQERLYWLERWHVDVNALMRKPGADQFRAAIRGLREIVRFLKRVKWRLSRGS